MFFPLAKCPSHANFYRSHDKFATILNFGPILGPMWFKKGHLWPKRVLLWSLGALKRPDTRQKCVVTKDLTQLDQLAAVWTKSCPREPSEDLRTTLPDQIQPKVSVTDRLKLGISFIPKIDGFWLKNKKIARAFFEKTRVLYLAMAEKPLSSGQKFPRYRNSRVFT